jgi:hypothetical protein
MGLGVETGSRTGVDELVAIITANLLHSAPAIFLSLYNPWHLKSIPRKRYCSCVAG